MPDLAQIPGRNLAITVEAWFLINLMLLPFVGFLSVVYLYKKHYSTAPVLAKNHLRQTFGVSLVGGCLLVVVTIIIALLGGFNSGYTWVAVVLYFTLIHTSLILMGAFGLSKALSGKTVCYALIGWWFMTDEQQRLRMRET